MLKLIKYLLVIIVIITISCSSLNEEKLSFREEAIQESMQPIHPGLPGKVPFWNTYAIRFIYAPAFDFKSLPDAQKYSYKVTSEEDGKDYQFKSDNPYASLSPIWDQLPVGYFKVEVYGLTKAGDEIGLAGDGRYYHAAPFRKIYNSPQLPYDKSAEIALEHLINEDYVQYWLLHKEPDPNYIYYRYPTKMFGALIIGAVTYARLKGETKAGKQARELAKIVADFLIGISFKDGSPLEYFPPTYRGYEGYDAQFNETKASHMNIKNTMMPYAADAGHAYLDLYDLTGDQKYFEAAKRIAETYVKTQLDNGSWYLFVNNETGEPTAPNIAIPTSTINYFNRLRRDYKVENLNRPTQRALEWILDNPVQSFNWQGQFEDVKASKPYENQSREQACELAMYLFKNDQQISLAEELVRFAEDQFVIWENPIDVEIELMEQNSSKLGYKSKNWITPCVQEQYDWWMPVARSAGIMIDTYWEAYKNTGREIYLAKAKSIANSFTVVQKAHHGDYPTYFTKYPMGVWLNNTVYPAKVMKNFQDHLKQLD